ncbi:MAG: cation-translocating P-type ATPase [Chloroflexota bacterium]
MSPAAPPSSHALDPSVVLEDLEVDPNEGLTKDEARKRLETNGPNELAPPERVSVLGALVDAVTEPFVILLAVAGLLAVGLGEVRDGLLVLFGLLPIVLADVITTYRGERALEELRAAAAPTAQVRREGELVEIPASDLVVGDIVLLRVGDIVPADLRITRTDSLSLDRSVLTGESLPEEGRIAADPPGSALAERRSVAYSGTSVVVGRGEGVVVATGAQSELGRIAGAVEGSGRGRSPLQRELDRLVRILLVVAIGLIAITSGLALIRGETIGAAVLAGISSAIAAIPEEPPVLLAVILGLGAYRLLRRKVLVRRLTAQETLGAIDLIITDKTGTLTENRLTVDAILTPEGPLVDAESRVDALVGALRAEDDAWASGPGMRPGSFTRAVSAALEQARPSATATAVDPRDLIEAEPPRDGRLYSRTLARVAGGTEELALGAPEAVLGLPGGDGSARAGLDGWRDLAESSAHAGRRLLLLAGRTDGQGWRPRALLSFSDPLREGIPEALREATEAGIQTIVVTGDHPRTAAAIARAAGLPDEHVLSGPEVDAMDDAALARALPELHVVARATPVQKLRLVEAGRACQRTVAVTGDGVNDAPALQRADVGVAMGSGTGVAREAADLVLGDDSFATLMEGLREGRRIVANVQKGLIFLTSTHVALLGYILVATLVGYDQPLLPLQILWLELFIDLAASVAFEREPIEPDAMRRRPRPRHVPLLTNELLGRITFAGSVTVAGALAIVIGHPGPPEHARWVAFSALVLAQAVRAYANRSIDEPITRLPPNWFLATACLIAALVQLAIPYIPPLAVAFRASPLDAQDVVLVLLVAVAPALVAQVVRATTGRPWVA